MIAPRASIVPLPAAAVLAACSAALAAPPESVTFTAVPSNGVLGSPANGVRSHVFEGGFALGRVDYSGTLTSQAPATWRTDARVVITAPGGQSYALQPFTAGTTYTTLPFAGSFYMPAGAQAEGEWTLRFYEVIDDGGPAIVDALASMTLTLTDQPAPPPAATDLGVLQSPGVTLASLPVSQGQVRWFRFELPRAALAARGTFLDIDTLGSSLPVPGGLPLYPDDTEIGLFDAGGRLIAVDDDSCAGFTSQLSFGAGTRPPQGDGQPADGGDGPLLPGVYYLVAGPYNVIFGTGAFQVTTDGSRSGTLAVRLSTNTSATFPCPADWNGDAVVNSTDISGYLTSWLSSVTAADLFADVNGDGTTNSSDISSFLVAWLAGLNGGC